MNYYLTFGGAAYDETTRLIVERAPQFGVDKVIVADDAWLMTTPFYREHQWLWQPIPRYYNCGWIEQPKAFGFGWCSWKPYIIGLVLSKLHPGDVLLYTDADTYPIADLNSLFDFAPQVGEILFEEQGCLNLRFTKRDCFHEMACDMKSCHSMIQACGRFQFFTPSSCPLIAGWRYFSVLPACQRWDRSTVTEDYPEFARHSCEQSVLTNLAWSHSIKLHRTPDQNGGALAGQLGHMPKDWDLYPQVFEQRSCAGDHANLSGSRFANIRSFLG